MWKILNRDDLYMTVYNPNRQLEELITQLAGAEGLKGWVARVSWNDDKNGRRLGAPPIFAIISCVML